MEGIRREFLNTIQKDYYKHCKEVNIDPSVNGFSEYLINRNLIKDLIIRMFLVVDKYKGALEKNLDIKYLAIWELEEEIGLKETRIRTILKHNTDDYRLQNRVIPEK